MRSSAYHQAAHAAVAHHFGGWAQPEIFARPEARDGERTWGGRCQVCADLSAAEIRVYALAGEVANCFLLSPDVEPRDIAECLDQGVIELSDTDRAQAGDFSVQDIATCLTLVRALWPAITRLAQQLIAEAASK